MNAKQAIRYTLDSNFFLLKSYLSDLSDADLLNRPVPGANHAAWQLGHLIVSQNHLVRDATGKTPIELPPGFAEQHAKDAANRDSGFRGKAEYMALLERIATATLDALEKLPDADLDKPNTGSMAKFAPTAGAIFLLVANHLTMHSGQIAVLRRKLGKPVLI